MPSTLFIRLLTPAERLGDGFRLHCQWLLADADGQRRQGWADYQGLQALANGQGAEEGAPDLAGQMPEVVALAPNDHVLCLECEVPGRRAGQIKQALPFVVEEFLATDIEDLHIAPGPVRSGAPVRCGLVAKKILEDWLACLASVNLPPQHLVAESELLPSDPECASILFDDAVALVRSGGQAANVERANLGLALSALKVGAVRCLNGALTEAERDLFDGDVFDAEGGAEVAPAAENGFEPSVISYLADRWAHQDGLVNLLQDAYKPAHRAASEAGHWRRIAALAGLWLLLGVAGMAAKGWWSSSQADALEAQSLAVYRSIFPEDRSVTAQSLRRRLTSRLGAPTQDRGVSLVTLMGHLAAALKPSMTVASIDYNRARGEFNVDLLLRNYEEVEALREALGANAETEITSAEEVDAGVRARFRLRSL